MDDLIKRIESLHKQREYEIRGIQHDAYVKKEHHEKALSRIEKQRMSTLHKVYDDFLDAFAGLCVDIGTLPDLCDLYYLDELIGVFTSVDAAKAWVAEICEDMGVWEGHDKNMAFHLDGEYLAEIRDTFRFLESTQE